MGVVAAYQKLEIQRLENENMIMKSLLTRFKDVVMMEYQELKCLKTAFKNVHSMYRWFFGTYKYSSYEQFLKTL